MRHKITSIGLALAGLFMINTSSATVTTQGWWHFGENGSILTDSTTNGRNYTLEYTSGAVPPITDIATGGPLDGTGFTSTNAAYFGFGPGTTLGEYAVTELINPYTPPATNYGLEMWFLARGTGFAGAQNNQVCLMSSGGSLIGLGPGGGATVRIEQDGNMYAGIVPQGDSHSVADFSPGIPVDTNHWIHLALVNMVNPDGSTNLIFYTNGVPCATNDNSVIPLTTPGGYMFIGTDGSWQCPDGYIDEERVFTFATGQFSTNDLLLRPLPSIVVQPQSTTVWNNGAANFNILLAQDPNNTYQWIRGTTNIPGATEASLYLPQVTLTDSGSTFDCVVANGANSATTSVATLTIAPTQTANNAAYRAAILGQSSLLAYFEVDGSLATTVANVADTTHTHDGTLEGNASYDGQTNRSYGQRALYLTGDGDVQVPANGAYEFPGGGGTVEALVDLFPGNAGNVIILSEASTDGTQIRYAFGASADGSALIYTNDNSGQLSWAAPNNLLNRLADVAFTLTNNTITAYLDGQSLGSQTQSGFGSASGAPLYIGSMTTNNPGAWTGTIDELAIYGTALSTTDLQVHNANFVFGTNTSSPTIISESSGGTLYAGGTVVLAANVGGTPPLSYQWRSNNVAIAGATTTALTLGPTTTNFSASYTVVANNSFGSTNSQPIVMKFVAPPNGYAAKIMSDNPSAYWRLDESSGTTLHDYAGGLNGTYLTNGGSFTLGVPGALAGDSDTAAAFTGGGYAAVPFSSILNPPGAFTLELWLKPNDNSFEVAVSSQFRGSPARLGYVLYLNDVGPVLTFLMGNASGYQVEIDGSTTFVPGNWYHTAIVYDGSSTATAYVFGYVDGTPQSVPAGAYVPNSSNPTQIGLRNDGVDPYNGTLDEVAFYNYALTQAQLKAHVSIGLPLKAGINASTSIISDEKPAGPFYDGIIASGCTWKASDSDGSTTRSGVMQFVSTNTSQITDFGYPAFNADQGTIMFWMRSAGTDTSSGNEGAMIFDHRSSSGLALIQHDDGNLFVQAQNNYNHFESSISVSDNKWHHCAFVYDDSSSGSVTLYLDGNLDSSAPNAEAWSWPVNAKFEIGADTMYDGGWWRNYNGLLDDFRMYNRQLTATEVGQAMGGAVVDTSALVVQFNFTAPPNGFLVSSPYGYLLSAPLVNGPYTPVAPATSPLPVAPHGTQEYFEGHQ